MTYKIAANWNNEGGLTTLTPQPRMKGIQDAREQVSGDGLTVADGYDLATLEWGVLTAAQYSSLLTATGLTSAKSAKVTLQVPQNSDRAEAQYNAIITRPGKPRYELGFWRGIEFEVALVEAI